MSVLAQLGDVVKPQRDVTKVALYRLRHGDAMAARLNDAAVAFDSVAARGVADRLRMCAARENVWMGSDLQRADDAGELYDGVGTLWACGSRLCPSCSASLRRRARRRASVGIESVRPANGERWRFVTLTAPTVPGAGLLLAMQVYQRAWSLLRKRQFWVNRVRGGVKGVEWTEGDTGDGYHVHLHLLVCGRWIEQVGLRDEWTECIAAAWRERGHDLQFNTRTNAAIVDVRLVRSRGERAGRRSASVSPDHALQEVCKYVCKGEAWRAVPDAHLVEVAAVERWPRLFEVFGVARTRTASEAEGQKRMEMRQRDLARLAEWIASDPRVGTPSPGSPALNWRGIVSPALREAALASLDTHNLSDGVKGRARPPGWTDEGARERGPTLRQLSVQLERSQWLKILALRVVGARAYRRFALSMQYPFASFVTLGGETFGASEEGTRLAA
jgi:hypothetical protein